MAATLNNLGHNYYCKKDYPRAAEYFEMAIDMQTKIKGDYDYSVALYTKNMGEVCFNLENMRLAERYC